MLEDFRMQASPKPRGRPVFRADSGSGIGRNRPTTGLATMALLYGRIALAWRASWKGRNDEEKRGLDEGTDNLGDG
ncbi:MAG TPA: hypothetical protein P5204_13550, partial [Kiritimatiellia bacterium]|nr:hypothetical protein [Kiritimatiellia bacterium]